jgi:hypothetical protein
MKKTLSLMTALVFALAFFVGAAGAIEWNTSTVGLKVVPDIESVAGNRTLNLGIMGLDELGNVDIYGEAGGSTIIAGVTSLLGNPAGGGATPAGAAGGTFAALTRYYTLAQGQGLANVAYPAAASGTDTVTVVLYEQRLDAGFNAMTREIARKVITVPVEAASAATGILDIEDFTPATPDANGVLVNNAAPANEAADNGIGSTAAMTAGVAGGEFLVKAYRINADRTYSLDGNANGTVTLTLTGDGVTTVDGNKAAATDTYTFTGTMANGIATVVVGSGATKAGRYKVVATMDGVSSVCQKINDNASAAPPDCVDILAADQIASVALSCNMGVVSNIGVPDKAAGAGNDGLGFDPSFTAKLLDPYGNTIRSAFSPGATVKVTDANAKLADFNLTIAAGANSVTTLQDASAYTAGLASLTASVPANPLIAASSPVSLKIVPANGQLVTNLTGTNTIIGSLPATTAGTVLPDFFQIGVETATPVDGTGTGAELDVLTASNRIKITSLATGESITVAVKENGGASDSVDCLFTKVFTSAQFIAAGLKIEDADGSYAGLFVFPDTSGPFAVAAASPSMAYIKNANGDQVSEMNATVVAGGYQAVLNGARVSMKDAYGNTNNQGTLTLTTTSGTAAGTITVGDGATQTTLTYASSVSADDAPTFNFTQPGITSLKGGSNLTIHFPGVAALDHFATFTGATVMPINGIIPLTIIPQSATNGTVPQTSGYYINYDTSGIQLQTAAGGVYNSGANVGAGAGRLCFRVIGLNTPGTYDINISSADGTVNETVSVEVKEYTLPLAVSESAATLDVAATADITITGGTAPYTVSSADTGVATASITGTTVTITGVAAGSTTVTVHDAAGDTADIAVSVNAAVGEAETGNPDTPQGTVDLGTTVDPAATTVTVAEGEANIAPQLNVADCTAVAQPLCYVYLPDYGFGVDLSAFVTDTCDAGVLTLDVGAIDFTDFGGNYDFYIGYVDGSGDVQYSAYRLVVE